MKNKEDKNCILCKKRIDSSRKINVCSSCRKLSKDSLSALGIISLGLVSISKKIKKWLVYFMVLIGVNFIQISEFLSSNKYFYIL